MLQAFVYDFIYFIPHTGGHVLRVLLCNDNMDLPITISISFLSVCRSYHRKLKSSISICTEQNSFSCGKLYVPQRGNPQIHGMHCMDQTTREETRATGIAKLHDTDTNSLGPVNCIKFNI